MKHVKLFEGFLFEAKDKKQEYFDEYMERWADSYNEEDYEEDMGDAQFDDAINYAEAKLKDPSISVEDYEPIAP